MIIQDYFSKLFKKTVSEYDNSNINQTGYEGDNRFDHPIRTRKSR